MVASFQLVADALRHHQSGALDAAEVLYQEILDVNPAHADALHLMGVLAHQRGESQVAVEYIQQAIQQNRQNAAFHSNMGVAHHQLGRYHEAVENYRQALQLDPDHAETYNNLGNSLAALGKLDEAVESFHRAVAIAPSYGKAYANLGNTLRDLGRYEAAIEAYRRAIDVNPQESTTQFNYAETLARADRFEEAIGAYDRVLELAPQCVEAVHNRGHAQLARNQLCAAVAGFEEAIRIQPNLVAAHNDLGIVWLAHGRVGEALHSFRAALRIKPNFAMARSNLLMAMHYDLRTDPDQLFEEHLRWGAMHERPPAIAWAHTNHPDPHRRLRIGYVSPDFRTHAVAYFFESILAHHDRSNIETICYAEVPHPDDTTARLQSLAGSWRDTVGKDDCQLADMIRNDAIDILVDLAGHTSGNRLKTFALKPAPLQVTYLGYVNTTGLASMDYRLTDYVADPVGEPVRHTEQLIRLPRGCVCYTPPQPVLPIEPLPALRNGYVTFGSFNNMAKITPETLALWAKIVAAVPRARLVLKARSFNDPAIQDRYRDMFAEKGLAGDRLQLLGNLPGVTEHLAVYNRIDIALDPFPYTGTATTCEALWMGVPVITLVGNMLAARMSASIITQIGLSDCMATTKQEYFDLATGWAEDLERLQSCRSTLRERMTASPVCDAAAYAQGIEKVYRTIWQRWCGDRDQV